MPRTITIAHSGTTTMTNKSGIASCSMSSFPVRLEPRNRNRNAIAHHQ